jgi:hypothetical protein
MILSYWQPGITTDEIDKAVHQMIVDNGAYPSPLGYCGYPKSVCTSVNECICHGIPDSRPLEVSHPKSRGNKFEHIENSHLIFFVAGWRYHQYWCYCLPQCKSLKTYLYQLTCFFGFIWTFCAYFNYHQCFTTFVMIFSRDIFWFLAWSCTSFRFRSTQNVYIG